MNAIVPGSGDAAKAVFSGVGRGIERVARLIEPSPGIVAPQAPAVILPRAQAERTPQHRPSPWTVPPIPAPGWEVAEECAAAMVFRSGLKFIVWSIEGGVYSKSHTFSTDENGARLEFARRCR